MLKALVPTLKGGLEVALLLAVLYGYLAISRRKELSRPLRWGAILGLGSSAVLAYGVESVLERELVEGGLSLAAALLALGLILWVAWRRVTGGSPAGDQDRKAGPIQWSLVFAAAAVLTASLGLNIALTPTRVFLQDTGLLSSEMAGILVAVVLGLGLAALAGVTLAKVVAGVEPRGAWVVAIAGLAIILVQEATTAVQVMLVRGMVPLTDWLFAIIVPLVNNSQAFYYSLLFVSASLALLAAWDRRRRRPSLDGLNPAERRKVTAASRRTRGLLVSVGLLLSVVILVDGASAIYAKRPFKLSPATPVSAQSDKVLIPLDSVDDGTLYRFAYDSSEGITVSFLVIYKGSGIYGVGLDACEFCGVAGYRQEKGDVVCNKCEAHINIGTIGFPGGCNPVPLTYAADGEFLAIPVAALEAEASRFAQ